MLKYSLITVLLFCSILGFSQEDSYVQGDETESSASNSSKDKGFDWDKVTIGGGFYAGFGTNTYFLIAPTIGYYLTDNILAGIGINYSYEENNSTPYPYRSHTSGGSVYGQYIFEQLPILAHAELESVNINVKYTDNIGNGSLNFINTYVGGGLKQRMGGGSYVYALFLWNLTETQEARYIQPNPVVRIGFAIGL